MSSVRRWSTPHRVRALPWTPSRVADLREFWAEGLSANEIADALGGNVTRNAVIGKAHRLGLEPRGSPIEAKPKEGS